MHTPLWLVSSLIFNIILEREVSKTISVVSGGFGALGGGPGKWEYGNLSVFFNRVRCVANVAAPPE